MIHKLAEGPITLTIARIEAQVGNFGPQFAMYGTNDELVYVSEKSTLSGLSRLNLTPESVVGATIRIQQVKKEGKTYTDIHRANAESVTPSSVASPAAPKAPVDLPALAVMATKQWTAQFNPRPLSEADFTQLFRAAL